MKRGRVHTPQACSLTSKDGAKELPATRGAGPRLGVPLDPMECSPPGSSVYEILQVRILEWVAILFSRGSS